MSTNSSEDVSHDKKITRRDFLKLAGAAGVVATLPSLIPFGKVFGGTKNDTKINQTSITNPVINKQTQSIHIFDLDRTKPQFSSPNGSRTLMNADNFPILEGMGAVLLRLEKGGIREPHWHPNAAELSLCVSGTAKMTIYSTNARVDTFTISPGQITFVPRAYWHDLENIGEEEVKFVIVYDNERPGDLGVSGSVGSLSARVLDRMFGTNPPGFFDQLNYTSIQDVTMGSKPVDFSSTSNVEVPNAHKFNLGGITPQIQTPGGTAALGMANDFPILAGLACFLLVLKPSGIVEPHTHPNAAELNYVINGRYVLPCLVLMGRLRHLKLVKVKYFLCPPDIFTI